MVVGLGFHGLAFGGGVCGLVFVGQEMCRDGRVDNWL